MRANKQYEEGETWNWDKAKWMAQNYEQEVYRSAKTSVQIIIFQCSIILS